MTIVDRYRVYTYKFPWSNDPYRKSSSASYQNAFNDFKVAKDWNYTAVLFDTEKGFLETYESWWVFTPTDSGKVRSVMNLVSGGLSGDIGKALEIITTEKGPLAKAMKLALEEAKAAKTLKTAA